MAITFGVIEAFFENVSPGSSVLDIGSTGVHMFDPEATARFVSRRGGRVWDDWKTRRSDAWNVQHPLGDLLTQAGYRYVAYDIFPGRHTQIIDLNEDKAREPEAFDLILNFGTTEHVFNQYNAFKLIHDSCAANGVMWHDLPMCGYFDHGFFSYHPLFFTHMAGANGYDMELLKFSVHGSEGLNVGGDSIESVLVEKYKSAPLEVSTSNGWVSRPVPTAGISVVLRKRVLAPFRVALETQTSDDVVVEEVAAKYAV